MSAQLDDAVAAFVAKAMHAGDFTSTVEEVVAFACSTLGTAHGGVTLIRGGGSRFETTGATDPRVVRADELQYQLQEGPCVMAAVQERFVRSPDVADDERWPVWGPRVRELGFGSVLSMELHGREQRIGALNLYGDRVRQFSEADAQTAHLFAYHASALLFSAQHEEHLRQALDTRLLIGQAEGILMERFGLDSEQAFATLRRISQHSNIKLRDIADELVSTRRLPTGSV